MAHYDCRDCGASWGIAYGSCESCTPKGVFKAARAYKNACDTAAQEFDDKVSELRKQWIQRKAAEAKLHYDEIYAKHKPKRI